MRIAQIDNGIVTEVCEINRPISDFPEVRYVECAETVAVGFAYDGVNFTPHATYQDELDAKAVKQSKKARDEALNNLTYDFGDGRIIQTRPKDELNIRNAIEVMIDNNIQSIGWVMLDNSKKSITAQELTTALKSGQLSALSIWENYSP